MKLVDVLVRESCVMDMAARTQKEALRELANALAQNIANVGAGELLDLLMEREKLGSTAMGDGIAIPHARCDALERIVIGFGRSRAGINFESIDGQPTHLFFLLVAPKKEGSAHLLTLARLSRVLSDERFRRRLLDIEDVDDLMRAIEEGESKL